VSTTTCQTCQLLAAKLAKLAKLAAKLAKLANSLHLLLYDYSFAMSVGNEAAFLFDGCGKLSPDSKGK